MINFRKVNLMETWPAMPEMDVVFMRNVLIYFDVATKKRIFDRLARVIRPGGYLFVGTVESTHNLTEQFTPMQVGKAICYQRIS
jgi:chemotaxis protein methyltransferase CheR